ncbi:MAG: hypothetical protein ACI9MC_003093 [Kiritimatiellia bacterium]
MLQPAETTVPHCHLATFEDHAFLVLLEPVGGCRSTKGLDLAGAREALSANAVVYRRFWDDKQSAHTWSCTSQTSEYGAKAWRLTGVSSS